MRSTQEDYTSRKGEDPSKMRLGVLNLIRIVECLKLTCQAGNMTEEGASMAYIFDYQSSKRVSDENDGAITLYEIEL